MNKEQLELMTSEELLDFIVLAEKDLNELSNDMIPFLDISQKKEILNHLSTLKDLKNNLNNRGFMSTIPTEVKDAFKFFGYNNITSKEKYKSVIKSIFAEIVTTFGTKYNEIKNNNKWAEASKHVEILLNNKDLELSFMNVVPESVKNSIEYLSGPFNADTQEDMLSLCRQVVVYGHSKYGANYSGLSNYMDANQVEEAKVAFGIVEEYFKLLDSKRSLSIEEIEALMFFKEKRFMPKEKSLENDNNFNVENSILDEVIEADKDKDVVVPIIDSEEDKSNDEELLKKFGPIDIDEVVVPEIDMNEPVIISNGSVVDENKDDIDVKSAKEEMTDKEKLVRLERDYDFFYNEYVKLVTDQFSYMPDKREQITNFYNILIGLESTINNKRRNFGMKPMLKFDPYKDMSVINTKNQDNGATNTTKTKDVDKTAKRESSYQRMNIEDEMELAAINEELKKLKEEYNKLLCKDDADSKARFLTVARRIQDLKKAKKAIKAKNKTNEKEEGSPINKPEENNPTKERGVFFKSLSKFKPNLLGAGLAVGTALIVPMFAGPAGILVGSAAVFGSSLIGKSCVDSRRNYINSIKYIKRKTKREEKAEKKNKVRGIKEPTDKQKARSEKIKYYLSKEEGLAELDKFFNTMMGTSAAIIAADVVGPFAADAARAIFY